MSFSIGKFASLFREAYLFHNKVSIRFDEASMLRIGFHGPAYLPLDGKSIIQNGKNLIACIARQNRFAVCICISLGQIVFVVSMQLANISI